MIGSCKEFVENRSGREGGGDSITVIVPAYNEENNLVDAICEILQAIESEFADYEIIIINDHSSDGTGIIADRLAAENPAIRVLHNASNRGLGANYRLGLEEATKRYITLINGKHDMPADQIQKIFHQRGRADMIIPYHINAYERSLFRRSVSRAFTVLLNVLFRLNLRYYNDSTLHCTEKLRSLRLRTDSYAITAEMVVKSLKTGCSYIEVSTTNIFSPTYTTKAFRLRNVIGVARFLAWMVVDIYLLSRR